MKFKKDRRLDLKATETTQLAPVKTPQPPAPQCLSQVPLVCAIETGRFTEDLYKKLLLNWRQQVVEGGRWITRAASSIESPYAQVRSLFIQHAKEEHLDFEMLEQNFQYLGGELEEIRSYKPNCGSEALSAFIMYRASLPNPFDLMGAMFIIEGLGHNKARRWGEMIQSQLQLPPAAVSFLLYHGENDEHHVGRLELALEQVGLDQTGQERLLQTAATTARLYPLQLEEISESRPGCL